MSVEVVTVSWDTHKDALRRIREVVFIDEQQVPREIEWDGADDDASHFLAVDESGELLGCARLLPGGQIGRMAVLAGHRGRGLGQRLLTAAIEQARRQGLREVHLHAQTHAAGFYRKAGFLPDGGTFMEAGIPHQAMTLDLPIPFEPPGASPRPVLQPAPGYADTGAAGEAGTGRRSQAEKYAGEHDCLQGLIRCLEQPRRKLAILSQHLDHALFDRPEVVEAVSAFARSSPAVDVRILISDSSLIVSRGHRLVELGRRLDSRIDIRRTAEDHAPGEASFVVCDDQDFFLMPDFREYQALADAGDPVRARRLLEEFDHLWARSAPDPELRILKL